VRFLSIRRRGRKVSHAAQPDGFTAWLNRPARPTELEVAQAERERAEQRLESVRKKVIRPMYAKGIRNQFSDHVRELFEGR
jgi:hypothetical protein